jgi:VWFA-related protein
VAIPSGLIAWWPAEGAPLDLVGANHATLQGGAGYAAAKSGLGFSLDGTNDHAFVRSSPILNVGTASGFSVTMWINPGNVTIRPLFEWNNGSTFGTHFWLYSGQGQLYANLMDTVGSSHLVSSAAGMVRTGAWQHVALTYDKPSGMARITADLGRDDFRVFDNGRSVPIVSFGNFQAPIHILILLDTSRSVLHSLSEAKAAVVTVLSRLRHGDSVQLGTFSNSLQLSPVLSADDSDLLRRLVLVPGANATSLYDALVEGCSVFSRDGARRIMFIVSDGMDTASSASVRTVMQRAAAANVTIYAIGLSSRSLERGRWIVRAPDSTLHEIAEDTGGRYVHAEEGRDLSPILAAMVEELHQQYLLAFIPTDFNGRLRSLVVTTRRPDIRIRARKHYWAPLP